MQRKIHCLNNLICHVLVCAVETLNDVSSFGSRILRNHRCSERCLEGLRCIHIQSCGWQYGVQALFLLPWTMQWQTRYCRDTKASLASASTLRRPRARQGRSYTPKLFRPLRISTYVSLQVSPNINNVLNIQNGSMTEAGQEMLPNLLVSCIVSMKMVINTTLMDR